MNDDAKTRILVIEDNAANRGLMVYLLTAFGYSAIEAGDGETGLGKARSILPHLIICDVHLPKYDGYQVVAALKNDVTVKKIPVVAVTALAMVGDRDRILAAGFDGYISKPIDPENFVEAVAAFLPKQLRSRGRTPQKAEAPSAATRRPSGRSGTILVVDDLPSNIEFLRSALEPPGYRVLTATGVSEALTVAGEDRPDLILCDWHMSPLGGHDLLEIAKNQPGLRDIPIVITSSTYDRAGRGHHSLELGAAEFIERPIEPESLLAKIDKLFNAAGAAPP